MGLSEKIKYHRSKILKLKQSELAEILEVSLSTVKNWESGISSPNVYHLSLLSLLFNVSTDYLLYTDHELELSSVALDDEAYKIIKNLIDYFNLQNKKGILKALLY